MTATRGEAKWEVGRAFFTEDILTGRSRRSTGVNNKINDASVSGACWFTVLLLEHVAEPSLMILVTPACVKQAVAQCNSSLKKQASLVKFYELN